MLTFEMLKPLGAVAAKLDLPELMKEIQKIDIKKMKDDDAEKEKLGMAIIGQVLAKLEDLADPLIQLIAVYKGIAPEEAAKLSVIDELKALLAEEGIIPFFKGLRF